jgi:hypothetical protein
MSGWLFGHCDDTADSLGAVGVLLKCWVPEILWVMLLAGGEVDVGRELVVSEGERESDLHRSPVRAFRLALEMHHVGACDIRGPKCNLIGTCIA